MTNWQIGESGTTVPLDGERRGMATFTVTNAGTEQDRAVLTITPLDGADKAWFTVEEPQRAVAPGASAVYPVKVEVPAGTAAGTYALQAVAYSADRDPGESSVTSKRVGFTVPEKGPDGFPKWLLAVIALAVVAVIAVVLFLFQDNPATAVVPDVENRSEDDARAVLQGVQDRAELAWAVEATREFNEAVLEGHVISQEPAPGTVLEEDATVTLLVSNGPPFKSVPDLAGITAEEAQARLAEAELALGGVETSHDEEVDQGLVLTWSSGGQERPPELRKGSEVDLVVSAGPPTDPSGPDIHLPVAAGGRSLECSVVPGGALSGADNLTMFGFVRNGGPGEVNRLVPVAIQSDRGHRARVNTAIGTGPVFNPLQVDLSPSDYNQSLRFTITADPDNEIVERDESNNELIVTVRLPDRPTTSRDVPCSSP